MRLLLLLTFLVALAACSQSGQAPHASAPATPATSAAPGTPVARDAVAGVVRKFGTQMQKISVLAPPDAVRAELPKVYGKLLSPDLLADWRKHPDQAIGREGSSPWPSGIEIGAIDCGHATSCKVTGKVDYVTSNEVAHGGVFSRRDIALEVARMHDGWRIASVHLSSPDR